MNERIQELEKQSYITFKDKNSFDCTVFDKEKFAELIARECISIMESAENGYKDYRNQIEDGMRNHCIGLIKNKFRIE